MLGLLSEVQKLQGWILLAGRSAHLDASINDECGGIYFDLTVFDHNLLVKTYSFTYLDTEKQNRATLGLLFADVSAI